MVALRVHRATGSDRHSIDHELVLTAAEGWLIGERPLPGEPSSAENKEGEEELKYYYSTLRAEVSLERMASLAKSRWAIEQFYEDGKGECGLSDYQGRRWEGLHRHLALSMLAYSFLMLHSSITTSVGGCCSSEGFPPRSGTQRFLRSTGRYWCGSWRTWCYGS
jgi:Transposase DDE domain